MGVERVDYSSNEEYQHALYLEEQYHMEQMEEEMAKESYYREEYEEMISPLPSKMEEPFDVDSIEEQEFPF